MKTIKLRNWSWFEKTKRGFVYLYINNDKRIRLTKHNVNYLKEILNE